MADLMLVRIQDLVGKPVAGLMADMRTRDADGSLKYDRLTEPRMVRMSRVYIKREGGHKWLRWEWEKNQAVIPFDCAFSGIRLDGDPQDYYLLMEPLP